MTLESTKLVRWHELNVDGLRPGMTVAEAKSLRWREKNGVLLPDTYNSHAITHPYRVINFEDDLIVAVAGETLFSGVDQVLTSGDVWEVALRKLPFRDAMISSEILDLTVMIVKSGPRVGTVYLSQSSWVAREAPK